MDIHSDLIIVNIRLEYDAEYTADKRCDQIPSCVTIAFYDKCPVYTKMMNSMDEAISDCTNLAETSFVTQILNKKMVDTCIEARQFEKACKLWSRMNITGKTTSKKGGCGCHG